MARYRKIDVRMWNDQKFRRLTAPKPNGRDLWQFLLTGPSTSNIPGVYRAYEETLAREIGWSVEGFREAFREVFREGMAKADWQAGLVLIPNAIKYDPPQSPNVIRSWADTWDELPECALKDEAFGHLKGFLEGLSKGFQEAFGEVCPQPLANPEPEPEPEQEEETDSRPARERMAALALVSPDPPPLDLEAVYRAYPRKVDKSNGLDALRKSVKTPEDYAFCLVAVRNFAAYHARERTEDKYIPYFGKWARRWKDWLEPPRETKPARDVTRGYAAAPEGVPEGKTRIEDF
jgi:hypothetical protein